MANQDYSKKQLLEMGACTNCQFCAQVCPTVAASQDGNLSAVFRIDGLKKILRSRHPLFRKLFRSKQLSEDQWKHFSDTVFKCTLCGHCQEVCPVGIQLKDLWVSLRQDMVHSEFHPAKLKRLRDHLEEDHNVFGEEEEERAEWVEDLRDPPQDLYIRDQAEVVYFTGCVSAYYPVAQKIPMALAEILEMSAVEFTLLGEDEWCCGFPLLGAGMKDKVQAYIDHNLEAVRRKKARSVVFSCPSCYQMWREYYPRDIEIFHVTQFLKKLIAAKRIPFNPLSLTVTYHDPCDLGRAARIFGEPREIIRSIPGIELVELAHSKESCRCCGGGGNLEMIDAQLAAEIARQKIEEVLNTGAQAVVTSCQQCVRTMLTHVRRNKIELEVLDITQLVHRALKK
jgi:heterodisulfide reductase subunit D